MAVRRRGGARAGGAREGRERSDARGAERVVEEPPSLAGLDALWSVAERQVPGWRTINLRIPASERAPVVFAIDKGDGGQPQHRSTLTLDRASAAVVSYEAFSDQSLGRRLRSISRFAHTGEVLGSARTNDRRSRHGWCGRARLDRYRSHFAPLPRVGRTTGKRQETVETRSLGRITPGIE